MVVPDRCRNHDYPHSNGTTCTGMDGVLPADMETIDVVRERIKDDDQLPFSSKAKFPSLLLVCKESYKVASKRYKRAFSYGRYFSGTYFDYERDILLLSKKQVHFAILPEDDRRHLMARSEACKIRNIALQFSPDPRPSSNYNRHFANKILAKLLKLFCNVENLTIVVENYLPQGYGNELSPSQNDNEPVLVEISESDEPLLISSLERGFSHYRRGRLEEDVNRFELKLCMGCLKGKRLLDIANGFVWNLPTIQWRILITAAFQAKDLEVTEII